MESIFSHQIAQPPDPLEERKQHRRYEGGCDCSAIVGESQVIHEICWKVSKMGPARSVVLITGESGTGKELVAQSLHKNSPRCAGPIVVVNCAAIPDKLLESELFGHVRGAFTDAVSDKRGLIEEAEGGSLFLDEISEINLEMQSKLLRVIEQGEFRRVGDTKVRHPEVRLLAATNRDLQHEVEARRFREDLFYRLKVLTIHIPSLRERREDIPALVRHFLQKRAPDSEEPCPALALDLMAVLMTYDWPGNVRELEHVIEYAVLMAEDSTISLDDLPLELLAAIGASNACSSRASFNLKDVVRAATSTLERALIERALQVAEFNHTRAAAMLGISRRSLLYKLDKYDLDRTASAADLCK